MDKRIAIKGMQFSSEIHKLIENQYTDDALTNGDIQGAIEAIILKAIYFGKTIE